MGYNTPVHVEKTEEFRQWLDALADRAGRARILVRMDRLVHGNPGLHRHLGNGMSELKIDIGPGYRVYYRWSNRRLTFLPGGDKSSQRQDIPRAKALATNLPE